LFISLYGVKAQGLKFGLGVNGQFPVAPKGLSDAVSAGIGVSGLVKYFITANMSIGGQIGYNYFLGKKQSSNGITVTPTMSIIPITANFDYYINLGGEDTQFYIGTDAGLAVLNTGVKVEGGGGSGSTSDNKSYFIAAPHAGVKFGNLCAEVQYRSIFTEVDNTGMIGLQVSYLFGSK